MPLTITNNTKVDVTITNEAKPSAPDTWAERDLTWDESGPAGDDWVVPGIALTKPTKNNVTITNENKN